MTQPQQPAWADQVRGEQDRDEAAVSRFVDRFAAVMAELGFPPMAARVFAALLATDSGQLTAAGLTSQLHVSAGAISGAVRYLIQLGLVSKERERGSRRDVYRVIDDVWYQSTVQRDSAMNRFVTTAREGAKVLGPGTPAGRRMGESVDYFTFMQNELPVLLGRWREHKRAQRQ
jgi:DNA-binding transcriptional regulator GbsR (MarR family)